MIAHVSYQRERNERSSTGMLLLWCLLCWLNGPPHISILTYRLVLSGAIYVFVYNENIHHSHAHCVLFGIAAFTLNRLSSVSLAVAH